MITSKEQLPSYLQKYIVEQDTARYTPIDQLVWKYIIRQLKSFLSVHGHPIYLKGMEATGITEDQIPHISELSTRLSEYGWTALPVSGFIPPAAFMELQSLGILPIASDMRTLGHLVYTPAPDIVHEAAGHAPILIDPEYTDYLRQYAKVAKKALISQEDLDIYRAIRELSDIKENPNSTPKDILAAEENLQKANRSLSHISEATQLSRMNWWTAEYGLIGSLEKPQIFGAGLLSSVGESKWCLSDKVKKIPLTLECIEKSYDITEPQPQLFVTPDFKHLKKVLKELADQMAFSRGGWDGLNKAIQAKTVNTLELNTGIQISGIHQCPLHWSDNHSSETIAYLKTEGPTQIAFNNKELEGHNKNYHALGYGTPIGCFKSFPSICPSLLTLENWRQIGLNLSEVTEDRNTNKKEVPICDTINLSHPQHIKLEYESGIIVEGNVKSYLLQNGHVLLISLVDATASYYETPLFEASWGVYDIVFGNSIKSVFGGPADYESYGEIDDFVTKRVVSPKYSEKDLLLQSLYQKIRNWSQIFQNSSPEKKIEITALAPELFSSCIKVLNSDFPSDWLLRLEIYEWMERIPEYPEEEKYHLLNKLSQLKLQSLEMDQLISEGLSTLKMLSIGPTIIKRP